MLNKEQLSALIKIIKEAAKQPPGNKLKSIVVGGKLEEEDTYYTACIAITGNPDVANLVQDLIEYIFQELAQRLSENSESNLYTM